MKYIIKSNIDGFITFWHSFSSQLYESAWTEYITEAKRFDSEENAKAELTYGEKKQLEKGTLQIISI